MAENASGKRMLISFTLPISCQICLGKVKQPIVCPNQHVFCSSCIEVWLQHNQQCPTCRVPITPENPCKQILGGQTQDGESDSYMSTPALRRARFDILYQDCEREIQKLQDENEILKNSNCELQNQLTETAKMVASSSELPSNGTGAASLLTTSSSSTTESRPQLNSKAWTNSSPKSSPSRGKSKARGERRESSSSTDRDGNYNCDEGGNSEALATLRSKLKHDRIKQDMDRIKQDMEKLKETNLKLSTDNRTLLAENGRLKQTAAARSPHKYEKYTSMAQQSQLDQSRREISQLKRALERSDTYIDELETELQGYNAQYGPLPVESDGPGDKSKGASSRDPSEDLGTRGTTNKSGDGSIPSTSACGIFEPMDMSENRNPLIVLSEDRHSTMPVCTNQDPQTSANTFTDDAYRNYVKNKKASRVCATRQHEHLKASASLSREDDSDDVSDLEDSDAVMTNTPSTAMDRLALDSSKKRSFSSLDESLSSQQSKVSPSCHRHLNFGEDHPKDSDLHVKEENVDDNDPLVQNATFSDLHVKEENVHDNGTLHQNETFSDLHVKEENVDDIDAIDQNATFSDLNFTMTSELSDCARLMKDAERRVENKRLNSQDINPEDQSRTKALQCSSDTPAFQDIKLERFENLISHSDPTSNREHHEKNAVGMSQINQDSANTCLTWSGFKPGFRSTPSSVSSESTEPVIKISSIHTLTSTEFIRTSQSANDAAPHNFNSAPSSSGNTGTLSLPCTEREQWTSSNTAAGHSATTDSVRKTSLCHPTIKSQLKPTGHLDAAQYRSGLETGSRLRSDVDSVRNACTFDSLCNKPYANDESDKVNSERVSLGASNHKVQTSSGAILNETDIQGYLPRQRSAVKRSTIKGSRKRYVLQDEGSNSPSKSLKY